MSDHLRPPGRLSKDQRAAWRDIVKRAPDGLIQESDLLALEVLACLLAEFRRDPDKMTAAKLVRLETAMAKFGLTPKDRQRLEQPIDPANDGWDEV